MRIPEQIVLYGTGLEGEKFWCKYHKEYEIMYCIDKRERSSFHGKKVYSIDQCVDIIGKYYIVVTVGESVYIEIKKILEKQALVEYQDFVYMSAVRKNIAFIYGNCHMGALYRYLNLNYYFKKKYFLKFYSIVTDDAPSDLELAYCDLLITQDIREENSFGKPSAAYIIEKHVYGKNIIIPNLYGYNLYFPQIDFSKEYTQKRRYIKRHYGLDAVDINSLDKEAQINAKNFTSLMPGEFDSYIDQMYVSLGMSVDQIKSDIMNKQIWDDTDVRNQFDRELNRIKDREKVCDFRISDFIENNYQEYKLFYNTAHPTGQIVSAKGDYIFELLNIESDICGDFDSGLGADELPVYGCVKKALNLRFDDHIIRHSYSWTLENRPENLEEYIRNYIIWVWGM